MDASEWVKKNVYLVDFSVTVKMCRKTIDTKAKRNDRYLLKQKWARENHLNKQVAQRL